MYVTQTTFEKVILQGAEIVQQSKSLLSWDINTCICYDLNIIKIYRKS